MRLKIQFKNQQDPPKFNHYILIDWILNDAEPRVIAISSEGRSYKYPTMLHFLRANSLSFDDLEYFGITAS